MSDHDHDHDHDHDQVIKRSYIPETIEYGYQPSQHSTETIGDGAPKGGYIPTTSGTDGAGSDTPPPGDD